MGRFIALALAAAVLAPAAELEILPAEGARLALEVEKTGLMRGKKHVFLFDRYRGRLSYDAARPLDSHVQLTIESASLRCIDTWISAKQLKDVVKTALDDMLAAARYPEIKFTAGAVRPAGDEFDVQGSLTIRDITKPVVARVAVQPGPRFEGTARFKMTDYGLKPPTAALGMVGTKDEMTLRFTLIAQPAGRPGR